MEMKRQINDLLERYRFGTLSDADRRFLESWYIQYQPDGMDYSPSTLLEDAKRVKTRLRHRTDERFARRRLLYRRWAAASILVLGVLSAMFYLFPQEHPSIMDYDTAHILPGGNRATLTLGEGKAIDLHSDKGGIVQKGGEMTYGDGTRLLSQSEMPILLTLTTPRGGQYQLTLPDGTRVWLHAASTLQYPSRFGIDERQVLLRGEAYFEVVSADRDSEHRLPPFMVRSGDQELTVLGTHFGVAAYPDEVSIKTTLVEGRVHLRYQGDEETEQGSQIVLWPGQQAALTDRVFHVAEVDPAHALAWKNGMFYFENEPLAEIMKEIARWYDIDVEFRGNNQHDRYGGSFYRTNNLASVLRKLELTGRLHFKLEGRRLIVMD